MKTQWSEVPTESVHVWYGDTDDGEHYKITYIVVADPDDLCRTEEVTILKAVPYDCGGPESGPIMCLVWEVQDAYQSMGTRPDPENILARHIADLETEELESVADHYLRKVGG